jgi:hypothetical protein
MRHEGPESYQELDIAENVMEIEIALPAIIKAQGGVDLEDPSG